MNELIEISGIKCDNPQCSYHNESVKLEEYPQWIDKPCPICGENLLTKENYDACMIYIDTLTKIVDDPDLMELAKLMEEANPLSQEETNKMAENTVVLIEQQLKNKK